MSLLLDALKKTGAAQSGSDAHSELGALSELSLTELEITPKKTTPPSTPTPGTSSTPRSTGENLFAAKKTPSRPKFNYTLGIVPTAMIIGSVLGVAGGIYVWIEIQPPKAVQNISSPPTALTNAAPRPANLPLALPAVVTKEVNTAPETAPNRMTSAVSEHRGRPGNTNSAPPAHPVRKRSDSQVDPLSAQGIQFHRQTENDSIYTALTAAYHAYKSGDAGTAWQRYREILLKDPKNRDALLGMAAIAQQLGQDDAAIQYYKQVLILDPRDPVAQAGMSAFSTIDVAAKESHLKLSLGQTPQSAVLHFSLGNLYTEQSRWGDAQQAYFNAYKLEPTSAQFAFNLAISLDHLGQKKLAAQYYGVALQLDTTGNAGFDRVSTQQRLNQLQAP